MDGIKSQDVQLGKWYKVLIGFATKPEVRSGYCVLTLLKTNTKVQVMGECGDITNPDNYIRYINSVIID